MTDHTTTDRAERRERYTAALADVRGTCASAESAAMAVADAELEAHRLALSEALADRDFWQRQYNAEHARHVAVVSALVSDRAAVLREAEVALRAQAQHFTGEFNDSDILHEDGPASTVATWKRAADLLRRLAGEAAVPDTTSNEAQADINSGPGWYEVISPRNATTCIVLVYEDGSLYLPEGDDLDETEFAFAAARGNAHRLVRADDLPAAVSQPGKEA